MKLKLGGQRTRSSSWFKEITADALKLLQQTKWRACQGQQSILKQFQKKLTWQQIPSRIPSLWWLLFMKLELRAVSVCRCTVMIPALKSWRMKGSIADCLYGRIHIFYELLCDFFYDCKNKNQGWSFFNFSKKGSFWKGSVILVK